MISHPLTTIATDSSLLYVPTMPTWSNAATESCLLYNISVTMASHVTAVFLAFFFAFSGSVAAIENFDFYYFVLMWPGSYCKQSSAGCCLPKTGKPEVDFFVKGLFPTPLMELLLLIATRISDLESELLKYWPNIKCPSSEGKYLWRNTWNAYGVCSGLSEHDYFNKALELREKIDSLYIFNKNGIVSTDYADYSLADVKKAILGGIGASAAIRCSKNQWDESQVYEIYLCVDKDAKTIIDCPVLPVSNCATRVVFGSFTYDMLKNVTSLTANPIRMRAMNSMQVPKGCN
ncbi:hypothetical protein Syun_007888 [Stephania yunnanensis]|uniref:Uncharacterized protein n=1 Tax=Stephania yunnanensis TaxID=152371 RepID=A0AAP0KZ90_9MAGN